MSQENENNEMTLAKWQAIASIMSSLAIPMALAVIGYFAQATIASGGLKKDYVQIATNILKDKPSEQDKELRAWAIQTLDRYSEVPFTLAATDALKSQTSLYESKMSIYRFPAECMAKPNSIDLNKILIKYTSGKLLSEQDLKQFLLDLAEESRKAQINTVALECLQDSIRYYSGQM